MAQSPGTGYGVGVVEFVWGGERGGGGGKMAEAWAKRAGRGSERESRARASLNGALGEAAPASAAFATRLVATAAAAAAAAEELA